MGTRQYIFMVSLVRERIYTVKPHQIYDKDTEPVEN